MAEVAQYQFGLKELAEILIKLQDIHDGVWTVGFNLNIGTGLMGPVPEQSYPSALVQIASAMLTKVEAGQPPSPLAVDAAVINPRPATEASGQPKARGVRRKIL